MKETKSRPKMVVELKRKTSVNLPSDVEKAFNEHYNNVHLPLMAKLPGIVKLYRYKSVRSVFLNTPMEGDRYIAEYEFENGDIARQALSSAERALALEDHMLNDYIRKYFTVTRVLYVPLHSISKE